jgi:hypothetical protein
MRDSLRDLLETPVSSDCVARSGTSQQLPSL